MHISISIYPYMYVWTYLPTYLSLSLFVLICSYYSVLPRSRFSSKRHLIPSIQFNFLAPHQPLKPHRILQAISQFIPSLLFPPA